jgi:hypothetical protein
MMMVRPSVVEEGGGSQQAAPGFEAASTAARKRKAEDNINDKLTTMAASIEHLMAAQKEMAGSQRGILEKQQMETIKPHGEEINCSGHQTVRPPSTFHARNALGEA